MAKENTIYAVQVKANFDYSDKTIISMLDKLYSKDFWKKFKGVVTKETLLTQLKGGYTALPVSREHLQTLRDVNDKLISNRKQVILSVSRLHEAKILPVSAMLLSRYGVNHDEDGAVVFSLSVVHSDHSVTHLGSSVGKSESFTKEVASDILHAFYLRVVYADYLKTLCENIVEIESIFDDYDLDDSAYVVIKGGKVEDYQGFDPVDEQLFKAVNKLVPYEDRR